MGKLLKAVKPVSITEKKPKVKKLLNNPGVSKATAKLNLKEARVAPLKKILKSKNDVPVEDVKPLKSKKILSKPLTESKPAKTPKNELKKIDRNSVKPEPKAELKFEPNVKQIPIMKTLKRKLSSESSTKVRVPKKKGNSPKVLVKKQMKEAKESPIGKTEEVMKKSEATVEKKIPEKKPTATIDKRQVIKGVSAILKLAEIEADRKKTLFEGEHQPIFLQVTCIKVPKVPKRRLRIMLPNTLVTDTDDVVLFVGDLKKGRAQDFEPTINHYKDLLEENDCTQIKAVIPLTQVKTEYDQYELKRKLLSSYDYFLTEGKIAGHLFHLLGQIFTKKRKQPTSIKMDSKNLKTEIDNALKKTSMLLHSEGNTHIVQVAHTAMKKQQILNNVLYVCKNLAHLYPGGWSNIRSLILKTGTSLPVPIYMTLKSKNKVKVPVVKPTRPNAHKVVSGELSTALGNVKVIVKPDGTVDVERLKYKKIADKSAGKTSKKIKTKPNTTEVAVENLPLKKTVATGVLKENLSPKENKESGAGKHIKKAEDTKNNSKTKNKSKAKKFDDSEEEIEEAEQAYLNEWQQEENDTVEKPLTQAKGKPQNKKQIKKKPKIIKKNKIKA